MDDSFSRRLLTWFDVHGRKNLPWQKNTTAYRVWVSEIMLQQTQVSTVIPYYLRFMESFPNVEILASASVDEVLAHWSGLGYYARGRNIHKAAEQIQKQHNGVFPSDLDEVVALPGIGRSTAGAILSISMGQRQPILDGNVKRVLTRYNAIVGHPSIASVERILWKLADQYTPCERLADYTQAIMDLGATVCTRSKPQCGTCPLSHDCKGLAGGQPTDFPTPKRKTKTYAWRNAYMPLLIIDRQIYLEKRPPAGIWGGLWSLPQFEDPNTLNSWLDEYGISIAAGHIQAEIKHQFSHFGLKITPITFRLSADKRITQGTIGDNNIGRWLEVSTTRQQSALDQLGLAAPVKQILLGNLNGSHS